MCRCQRCCSVPLTRRAKCISTLALSILQSAEKQREETGMGLLSCPFVSYWCLCVVTTYCSLQNTRISPPPPPYSASNVIASAILCPLALGA